MSERATASYHFRITRFSLAHPCARPCGADRAIRHTHARYPPSGSFAATTADAAAVVDVEKTPPLKKSPPTLRPTSLRRTFVGRRSRGRSPLRGSYHAADTHPVRIRACKRVITHTHTRIRPPSLAQVLARSVVCRTSPVCALPHFSNPREFLAVFRSAFPACVPRHADVPAAPRPPSYGGLAADLPVRRNARDGDCHPLINLRVLRAGGWE